jgi:uncharacterized protein YndB with AHSA1/START domain
MLGAGSVQHGVSVPLPPERAFALFAEELGSWWPPEYTWSQDTLEEIGIEPRQGGMCFERGPHGFRCDWGRVLAWEPGARLELTWQIGPSRDPQPNPDKASVVEVRFGAEGDGGTRVELEHRLFERHGEDGEGYAAAMGSEQGWPYILGRYAAAAGAS